MQLFEQLANNTDHNLPLELVLEKQPKSIKELFLSKNADLLSKLFPKADTDLNHTCVAHA